MVAPADNEIKQTEEVELTPPLLADQISMLDPVAIAKESGETEEKVRTRLSRLVQKVNQAETDIRAGKSRENIGIFYDNGLLFPGKIDACVINVLEKQHGAREGYDSSLEAIYRDVPGSIQGVRQAVPTKSRVIKDGKGDVWKPAVGYHRSFDVSGIGNSESKPGKLVKSLSYIKAPNNQPIKTS
ncbi:hypothetical protein HZC27_02750 [Candidatus Roizmanbacteria bacterium]|nr:hypothetical protein [Candidatus Roizmanbacteria bacterium]